MTISSLHRSSSSLVAATLALVVSAVGCGDKEVTPDASNIDAPPDVGTMELSWVIQNAGATLGCDEVLGISVEIEAIPDLGGVGVPDAFVCDVGSGQTMAIASDTYDVDIWLASSNSRELAPRMRFEDVVVTQGSSTSIGEVVFEVLPQGNVEFALDADAVGGNCAAEADGGAEITEFSIEYRDAAGNCVPSTFIIGDGANQTGGTYTSDCLGARYACIESDQTIRGESVPSGTASMNIVGYRGVEECYTRTPRFAVPGNDLTTTLSPQVLNAVGVCVPAP